MAEAAELTLKLLKLGMSCPQSLTPHFARSPVTTVVGLVISTPLG